MKFFLLRVVLAGLFSTLGADAASEFSVHEWGTFTSVQGADGVQMEWNPFVAPELPNFVYSRNNKNSLVTRQRMETPVIYFYTDRPRTLDVSVKFPGGLITEWYPGEAAAPFLPFGCKLPALNWPKLQISPSTPGTEKKLLTEPLGSHYYAARDTDAAIVRFEGKSAKVENEKFLFYRGVASFMAPLHVTVDKETPSEVTLENTGPEELRNFFLYQVTPEGGRWIQLASLLPGQCFTLTLPNLSQTQPFAELPKALHRALMDEGLYEREATAMINTWKSSWFAERGLRVLYTLPREWTNRTLPLTITPAPASSARVMVARAEILTPEVERALQTQVEDYIAAPAQLRPTIVEKAQALGLGRFLQPAMSRVAGANRPKEFAALAWELYSAIVTPKPEKPVARHSDVE